MSHGGGIHQQVEAVLLSVLSLSVVKAVWYVSMVVQALSLRCHTFVLTSVLMRTGLLEDVVLLIILLSALTTL